MSVSGSLLPSLYVVFFFFFQAEDGIRDYKVTGVQTCALPIYGADRARGARARLPPRVGAPRVRAHDGRGLPGRVEHRHGAPRARADPARPVPGVELLREVAPGPRDAPPGARPRHARRARDGTAARPELAGARAQGQWRRPGAP